MNRRSRFLAFWLLCCGLGAAVTSAQEAGSSPSVAEGQDEPVDRPAAPLQPIRPHYPSQMLRSGIEGEVLLRFVVDATGTAHAFEVVRSSHEAFAREAVQAVQRVRFRPAERGGHPVSTQVRLPVKFLLEAERSCAAPKV